MNVSAETSIYPGSAPSARKNIALIVSKTATYMAIRCARFAKSTKRIWHCIILIIR